MASFFTYSQAKYLLNVFENMIEVGMIDFKKIIKNRNLKRDFKLKYIDNYENNFLVYSLSPVKDWVLIMYIWRLLENVHSELKYLDNEIIEKFSILVSSIIDSTENMKEVYSLLTDKCFNK